MKDRVLYLCENS